ncbi:MAG: hypothetical protein GC136_04095 [Alphaproteobacteria bacterium]|nr:hypothetical protein [Alphaproteobacteria bacterium]
MKKLVLLAAVAALVGAPVAGAFAEEAVAAAEAPAAMEATLKDGTKVSVEGDHVFVVGADGTKTAAPDGTHELADGTTLETKDGVKVAH